MPAFEISFDIHGDKQYARAFQMYEHEVRDLSTPFGRIGHEIVQSVGDQFLTEGAHSGAPWQPLSAAYAAWKLEHFGPNPLLVATSQMRSAMLNEHEAVTVTEDSLVYEPHGERVDEDLDSGQIAKWHQDGDGHNPQRKMVDLTLGDRRGFDRTVVEWLNEVRRGTIGAAH